MSIQGRIGRTGGGRVKRALGVQAALEWAFRIEQAQLELPLPPDVTASHDDGQGDDEDREARDRSGYADATVRHWILRQGQPVGV